MSAFNEPVLIFSDELSRLASALVQHVESRGRDFAPQLLEALEAFREERFAEAINQIKPPLMEHHDLVLGYALLALCFLHEGKLAEVIAEQEALDRLSPELSRRLRTCYRFPPGLKGLLRDEVPQSPIPIEAMPGFSASGDDEHAAQLGSFIALGKLARANGHHGEALHFFGEAIDRVAGQIEGQVPLSLLALAHFERGFTFIEARQLEKAKQDLQRAVALDSRQPRFYIELGYIYNKEKKHESALECYVKAKDCCDQSDLKTMATIFRGMGSAYIDKGDLSRAGVLFRESLEMDPDSSVARNELSYIQEVLSENDDAVRAAKSAYETALSSFTALRDDTELRQLLKEGADHLGASELDAAETTFRRSLAVKPGNEVALNALGYIEAWRVQLRLRDD